MVPFTLPPLTTVNVGLLFVFFCFLSEFIEESLLTLFHFILLLKHLITQILRQGSIN